VQLEIGQLQRQLNPGVRVKFLALDELLAVAKEWFSDGANRIHLALFPNLRRNFM